jgi:hypothetical protein
MNRILVALILVLAAKPLRAAEVVLPYSAFGPQAAAYELIGMEWWQWNSQGDDDDRDYPIKVVVYWDQTKEETAKRHPVDQSKDQDFRYVEYSKAVEHLERTIKDFQEAKQDSTTMERALAELKKQKAHIRKAMQPN